MLDKEHKIRILPEEITNKIAAGEVIERPASVVKELIENSIDAGSKQIVIRLTASGLRLIEVTDDGVGMSEQDAILAIERHATSKIKSEKDLEAILTLGFRGEALSSISAVSQFILTTRRAHDEVGTQIIVHGGILKTVSPIGSPQGTKISVNRLFFNTPVRLKFLKGLTTELSHTIEIVQRYALAHENIGFKLIHNDKVLFDISPDMNLLGRISSFWGKSTVSEMIQLKRETHNLNVNESESLPITVSGFIGLPSLTRSHRSHQLFFVNKRPVYSKTLQYSLEEAYRNLLMVGRYPVAILFLELPAEWTDVNIHPTKREIKFRDDRIIAKHITFLLRNQLSNIHRVNYPSDSVNLHTQIIEDLTSPQHSIQKPTSSFSDSSNSSKIEKQEEVFTNHQSNSSPVAESQKEEEFSNIDIQTTSDIKTPETISSGKEINHEQEYYLPHPFFSEYNPGSEVPMQIFDSYLVLSEKDRLLIIDQHALHERLNFEQLKKELQENNFILQRLVIPIVIEVPSHYSKLLEENLSIFEKIGIEIELFGDNTFQITAICALYDEDKIKDTIFTLLEEMVQADLFKKENYFESLLSIATKACKKSIKAGDKLEPLERLSLIQGFKSLTPPYTCPHGRPILIELTIQQMEKSFRRRP
ncbi:MAG TPA: DNA mismatch repair endonuclease MutL [Candidatus Hydrogenedens sp.]|nr:DNA mismatch repair endonuclease MutL [Candidatus Hydrogenedens sp.]